MSLIQPRNKEVFDTLSFGQPVVCLVTKDIEQDAAIAVVRSYDNDIQSFITTDNQCFKFARPIKSTEELDEIAVDIFAESMKIRLDEKRQQGRRGWHICSQQELSDLLTQSIKKGNLVDIANLSAFMFLRGFEFKPSF